MDFMMKLEIRLKLETRVYSYVLMTKRCTYMKIWPKEENVVDTQNLIRNKSKCTQKLI